MKAKVIRAFVYKGKDCFEGDVVDIAERDVVALARRGLIEIVKEKANTDKNKK